MTKDNENFPGETGTNPEFDKAVREIKESLLKETPSLLDTCALLANAYKKFPGIQKELAERLSMSRSELNKRIRIGDTDLFYDEAVRPTLPAGSALLSELSRVKHLDDAVRNNAIRPDLTRAEIIVLRQVYGGDGYTPWTKSPPTQAQITSAASSVPTSNKRKWTSLPDGICVVVEMPKTREVEVAIRSAIDAMREAGAVVYDQWTIDDQKRSTSWNQEEGEVIKRVEQAVRAKIRDKKKEYRKNKKSMKKFGEDFGTDELEFDGTLERARSVLEQIDDTDFDDLVQDIRGRVPEKSFVSKVPVFEADPKAIEDAKEMLKSLDKKPKKRDFSNIDFN